MPDRKSIPTGSTSPSPHGDQFRPDAGRQPGLEVPLRLRGSRLEGLNKRYGTEILLGENTARLVEGSFALREVDMVRVKGRTQTVRIYELLARFGASLALEQEKALRSYGAGLEAYRHQAWDQALAHFRQALTVWPGDGPSQTMAERCQLYQGAYPPEDWDGTFEQTFKR